MVSPFQIHTLFTKYLIFVYCFCSKTEYTITYSPLKGGETILAKNTKQTSKSVASKASAILRDGRSGSRSKSVAASALSQTRPGKKK